MKAKPLDARTLRYVARRMRKSAKSREWVSGHDADVRREECRDWASILDRLARSLTPPKKKRKADR